VGEAESSSESFLPVFHPRDRNDHLGSEKQEEQTHFQLQADESRERWKANEERVAHASALARGKRYGKHPAQKPMALLERIVNAASKEGDLILDPFMGSATSLLSALELRRATIGCEQHEYSVFLSILRICSELIQVHLFAGFDEVCLDLGGDPMDRSMSEFRHGMGKSLPLKPVHHERRFYFIGRTRREVIFTVLAKSLEDAWREFRASGNGDSEAIFVVKTETEIYVA
jgi:DNA methylase